MPMNRYEIRDEYSLADPELYRAADKDDPEALLEGVAMAGLVGVLRQLGDLAEFAAEIFHDLHEEVMVTAARGHTLMIRVQQLEADIPSLEKEFLSRTDHSSFFYNSGVDWHGNRQVDQNLVTQGDLPRFVMDSYEECRGPPRLFLLDKFDVAGSGACLKRYTDPSFFKVETSATANADVLREKKFRKVKKRGSLGRYGETPEFLQASSHAKLHQLLVEDPVDNGVSKPTYRAKLKRRPNGFPFATKSGMSYMEGILKSPSPEHKMIHGIIVSSPLEMSIDDCNESELELSSMSPARESEGRKGNPPYADIDETMLNPSMDQTNYASSDIKTYGLPSYLNSLTECTMSASDDEMGGKDLAIDGEIKMEDSLISYQSDEIASEIDNYVDAPSIMESEMDTDSELRVKKDLTIYTKNQPLASLKNQEHCHSLSLDSQSTGDFSISDEGNNLYKKEMSSFSSSNSGRTSEKLSADGFSSADIPEFVIVNVSSLKSTPEHFPVDKVSKAVISTLTNSGKGCPDTRPNFEQPAIDTCSNSISTLPYYDLSAVARGVGLGGAKSDETFSNSDDEEKKGNVMLDSPCSPSVSHSKSLGGDSRGSSSGQHLVDAEIHYASTGTDDIYHTSDRVNAISAYMLHEEDSDQKDLINLSANMASIMNVDNIISQNTIDTEEIGSKENPAPSILDNKVAKLTDNFVTDCTDIACDEDNAILKVSEGVNQSDNLYTEYPKVVSETDSEDHCSNSSNLNQISTETLVFSGTEHSPVLLEAGLDTQETELTPEDLTTINGTSELGKPKSSDVVGLQVTGIANDVAPNDLVALENSFYVPENLEDSSGTSYAAERNGINPDSGISDIQLTEISSFSSLKLLTQVVVPVDEFDSVTHQSETARMASSIPAVSDSTTEEDVSSSVSPRKLVVEQIPCLQDLGQGILEKDMTSLSGFTREPEVVEEEKSCLLGRESGLVEENETAVLDFDAVCRTEHDDHPKPELSHTDSIIYYDSEVKQKEDTVNAAQIQPPLDQSCLDTEEESAQQRIAVNHVSDVDTSHIRCVSKESVLPETIALSPTPVEYELADSCIIASSESSSVLPASQLQMRDHGNDRRFGNLASSFLPETYPSSESALPGGTDAYANLKDPLVFKFSPRSLFSETNQINLDESHPLPPLPPLQWRMGKFRLASSTTEVDKMETKELFPQEIFPSVSSIGNVKSVPGQVKQSQIQNQQITLKEKNLEHGCSSLETNSLHSSIVLPQKVENEQPQLFTLAKENEVSSPAEQLKQFPIQIQQITLKEENSEHGCPSLETNSLHSSIVLPQKEENEQPQLFILMKESEVPSPAEQVKQSPIQSQQIAFKEENLEHGCPSLEKKSLHSSIVLPEKAENEHLQFFSLAKESEVPSPSEEVEVAEGSHTVKSPAQIVPRIISKEETAEPNSPTLESDSVNQAADPPPKVEIEQQQQQLLVPTQESEVPSPAVEDGVTIGSRKMILPRTCNPVIGSVAALDKNRLRKVTEQTGPQMGNQHERNAMLEQIRAKTFSLKPTSISRPNIQGPNTNLKVAAILEKANAIRQAFAGSDEDEDCWSDS